MSHATWGLVQSKRKASLEAAKEALESVHSQSKQEKELWEITRMLYKGNFPRDERGRKETLGNLKTS